MARIRRRSRKLRLQTSQHRMRIRLTHDPSEQMLRRLRDRWRKEADRQYFLWQRTRTLALFRARRLEREAQRATQDDQREG